MSICCVVGCRNRYSPTSKLRFYRMPSGLQPFWVKRRALWQQAIQEANGSSEELTGNIRVCGAHFVSGQASMDIDNVDFVPTVFKRSQKKKSEIVVSRKRCLRSNAGELEANVSESNDSSVLIETDEPSLKQKAPSEILMQESGETLMESAEPKATLGQLKMFPSIKLPAGCPSLDRKMPVVVLKCLDLHKDLHHYVKPGVRVVHGVQDTNQSQHQCALPKEPSFPCNMCHRSFTSVQSLKRHKLLHVRDKRKCGTCGVMFCRRHPMVFMRAVAKPLSSSSSEEEEEEAKSSLTRPLYHFTTTTSLPTTQCKITIQPSVTMKETSPLPQSCKTLPLTTTMHTPPAATKTVATPQRNATVQPLLTMNETMPIPQSRKVEPNATTNTTTTTDTTTTMHTPPAANTVPTHQSNTTVQPSLTMSETLPIPLSSKATSNTTTATTTTVPTPSVNMPEFMPRATTTVPTPAANTTVFTLLDDTTAFKPLTSFSSTKTGVPIFLVPLRKGTMTASPSPSTRKDLPISASANISPSPLVTGPSPMPQNTMMEQPLFLAFTMPADATTTGGPTLLKSRSMQPRVQLKSEPLPKLCTSMKFFSPDSLTSAFIEVERRYTYVPRPTDDAMKQVNMKLESMAQAKTEEPVKLPPDPPAVESIEQEEFERIAYDLEIVI